MKTTAYKIFSGVFAALAIASILYAFSVERHKQIYVDLEKAYDEFTMKKEYDNKYKVIFENRQHILDSLKHNLVLLGKQLDASKNVSEIQKQEFQLKQEEYYNRSSFFEEDMQKLQVKFNDEIIVRIKEYIEQYAQANNIDLIVSGKHNNNVLFCSNELNKTQEIVQYINKKYNGN
jgi:outer membrane protein